MIKRLLFTFAVILIGFTAAWAQENVAHGKKVYLIGDQTNVTEDALQALTDGVTNAATNLWDATTDATNPKCQSFYIDLGSEQHLGAIRIDWEGACGSDYTVKTGTADADGNITWGDAIVTETGLQGGGGFNQTKSYTIDATTQYLRFDCTKAFEPVWGVKIFEFYAYTYVAPKLTSLGFNHDLFRWVSGQAAVFKANPYDQNANALSGNITYSVSPSTTAKLTADGNNLTLNATAAGTYTITATDEAGNTASRNVALLGEAAPSPTFTSDNVLSLFCDTYGSAEPGNSGQDWRWHYNGKERYEFNGNYYYLVHNVGTFGVNIGEKDISAYDKLHASIFVASDTKGHILVEGTSINQNIELTGGKWNDVALDISGNKETKATWVHIYLGESSTDNQRCAAIDNVYYSKGDAPVPDTEAPVLTKAEVKETNYNSAVITVSATDNQSTTITYVATREDGTQFTTTAPVGQDYDWAISGLQAGTTYTLNIVAKDASGNQSAESKSVSFTTTSSLPAVPKPTLADYKTIYSPYLGKAAGYIFADWGGGKGAEVTIEDKTVYQISNFRYYGSQFDEMDVTGYETLHLDILPMQNMTLTIVPITRNADGNGNMPEKGYQFNDLVAGKWNSLEVPVKTYTERGANMTRFFQIKYVSTLVANENTGAPDGFGHGDGKQSFIVGNVYLYNQGEIDTEAPVLTKASVASTGYNNARITVSGTDNKSTQLTFTATVEGIETPFTVTGATGEDHILSISGLQGNTVYTASVIATDKAGNSTAAKTINFKTTSSLPAVPKPIKKAYKTVYSPYLGNAANYDWYNWGASTSKQEISISGKTVIEMDNFTYYGSQFDMIDASGYERLHLDILPLQDMNLTIVPILRNEANNANLPEKGMQFSLVGGEWNSLEIPVANMIAKGQDMKRVYQIKYVSTIAQENGNEANDAFDTGDGTQSFIVGNVYFWKNDTEKPVVTATVKDGSVDAHQAVLTVTANDNNAENNLTIVATAQDGTTFTQTVAPSETAFDWTLTDLKSSTDYTVSLVATDYSGNQSEAANVTFTTLAGSDEQKPVITNLTTADPSSTMLTLKVTATDNANGRLTYTVTDVTPAPKSKKANGALRAEEEGAVTPKVLATATGNAGEETSIRLTGLKPFTKYSVNVTATDLDGNESEAENLEFRTLPGAGGSGTATSTAGSNSVDYIYDFTEYNGKVTFRIIPNGANATDYINETYIDDYSIDSTEVFYTDKSKLGTKLIGDNQVNYNEFKSDSVSWYFPTPKNFTIKIICWWAVNSGRSVVPDTLTYKLRGYITGVQDVIKAEPVADPNVYTITGILVRRNATTLQGLPKGIYIWNHKKVLVK